MLHCIRQVSGGWGPGISSQYFVNFESIDYGWCLARGSLQLKEFNLGTKEAKRIVGSEQDKNIANSIMRGLEIWTTFEAAQKSADVYNTSWRKL